MRVDLLEETLDRLEREGRTPKFIYTVPTFQNPAGVTMSLDRRRRLVALASRARAARARGQPVRAAALRGRPAAAALRARRRRVRDLPRHVLEDPRRPGLRLGWTAAPRPVLEKLNLGKQGADLCSSTFGQHFVVEYFAQRDWRDLLVRAARALPAPARHDARRARGAPPGRGGVDAARAAACSSGRRCRTTSTRPTCSPARCASTSRSCPGAPPTSTAAAAPRCGSTSPAWARTTCARACGGSARSSPSRSGSTRRSPAPSRRRAAAPPRPARRTPRARAARVVPLRRRAGGER